MSADWHAVLAMLEDERRLDLFCSLASRTASGESTTMRVLATSNAKEISGLIDVGLVSVDRITGVLTTQMAVLTAAIGMAIKDDRKEGAERFYVGGRIVNWPRKWADRELLLDDVAQRVLVDGERVDEQTLMARLGELADDPVSLRRALVDTGRADRERDGSAYWRDPMHQPVHEAMPQPSYYPRP